MVGPWWARLSEGSATSTGRSSPAVVFFFTLLALVCDVEGAPGAQDTGPGWTPRARLSTLPCSHCRVGLAEEQGGTLVERGTGQAEEEKRAPGSRGPSRAGKDSPPPSAWDKGYSKLEDRPK